MFIPVSQILQLFRFWGCHNMWQSLSGFTPQLSAKLVVNGPPPWPGCGMGWASSSSLALDEKMVLADVMMKKAPLKLRIFTNFGCRLRMRSWSEKDSKKMVESREAKDWHPAPPSSAMSQEKLFPLSTTSISAHRAWCWQRLEMESNEAIGSWRQIFPYFPEAEWFSQIPYWFSGGWQKPRTTSSYLWVFDLLINYDLLPICFNP